MFLVPPLTGDEVIILFPPFYSGGIGGRISWGNYFFVREMSAVKALVSLAERSLVRREDYVILPPPARTVV